MKNPRRILSFIVMVLVFLSADRGWAQPEGDTDRTLSPYFFVKSDDPELDQLPLKSTLVKVNVSGVIADVVVTQVGNPKNHRNLTFECIITEADPADGDPVDFEIELNLEKDTFNRGEQIPLSELVASGGSGDYVVSCELFIDEKRILILFPLPANIRLWENLVMNHDCILPYGTFDILSLK